MYRSGRAIRGSAGFHAVIESALAHERASELGRAGRRLDEAIDTHRLVVEVGTAEPAQVAEALKVVAHEAWKLLVQRECAGFHATDGLAWLRANYAIPDAAIRLI